MLQPLLVIFPEEVKIYITGCEVEAFWRGHWLCL